MTEDELIEVLKDYMENNNIRTMNINIYPEGMSYGNSFAVISYIININKKLRR